MLESIELRTSKRSQAVEITDEVRRIVRKSGIEEGICVIYVPHTTAGVCINEHADPSVMEDVDSFLSKLVPRNANYKHLEGNADSHIKSVIVGNSIHLIISKGDILLGTWQGIFFMEFDGPRSRRVFVKVIGG